MLFSPLDVRFRFIKLPSYFVWIACHRGPTLYFSCFHLLKCFGNRHLIEVMGLRATWLKSVSLVIKVENNIYYHVQISVPHTERLFSICSYTYFLKSWVFCFISLETVSSKLSTCSAGFNTYAWRSCSSKDVFRRVPAGVSLEPSRVEDHFGCFPAWMTSWLAQRTQAKFSRNSSRRWVRASVPFF